MRLTLIGPVFPYRGGIAHFNSMLALNLAEQGNIIQVISFKNQYPRWLYPGKSDKDFGEGRLKVKSEYLLSLFNPITWLKTFKTIRAFKPEKVVIQWWVTFWAPAFGALTRWLKWVEIPVLYVIHNALPHEPKVLDKFFARFALKHGHQFVVLNEGEIELLKLFIPKNQNITCCTLPLFSVFPEIRQTKKEVRDLLGLPQDYELMLFFGIVRRYKGLSVLLSAVSRLKKEGFENIGLVIAGEFWENKQKYLDEICTLGILECVWIVDRYISDLETAQHFKATDLFVAPYIGGTQSATVKTAMYFGTPMVITDIIADEMARQNIDPNFIVPPNDAIRLASAIKNILTKPKVNTVAFELNEKLAWECIRQALLD